MSNTTCVTQEGWRYLSAAEAVEQLHRHLCDFFTCELLVRFLCCSAITVRRVAPKMAPYAS